jgi:hypothetical protein
MTHEMRYPPGTLPARLFHEKMEKYMNQRFSDTYLTHSDTRVIFRIFCRILTSTLPDSLKYVQSFFNRFISLFHFSSISIIMASTKLSELRLPAYSLKQYCFISKSAIL